ncbi:MAG: hypothetical protein LBK61_06845 [Spirochaetaceae bacterium]|nr:hypothetical protein [Spirochaetaceae bacterium]
MKFQWSADYADYARSVVSPCAAPAGAKTLRVFIPLRIISDVNPTPILAEESAAGRQNTVMRRLCFPFGRAMPPHDGILLAGNDAG